MLAASASHLEAICDEVWVSAAPGQRSELGDADEPRQVQDLAFHVLTVAHAAQVEQLRACGKVEGRIQDTDSHAMVWLCIREGNNRT